MSLFGNSARGPSPEGGRKRPPAPSGRRPAAGLIPLVLHVDMDAFFASVEIRSDPRLTGLPVAVGGGPGKRGVVTTASYAARVFGVASGMSMAEALDRCPDLIVLPVDPPKMVHESLSVLSILDAHSTRVEPASIDEAYVELPSMERARWEARAHEVGESIRSTVRERRGITCSVGAAVNKLQAKMASRLDKPDGLTLVPPGSFADRFGSSPVRSIPGVGPRTGEVLAGLGVFTVGDLLLADPAALRSRFGMWGSLLASSARGDDARTVIAEGEEQDPRSAGHETTFAEDVSDPRMLRATLLLLADRVARRLRRGGFRARVVEVRFRIVRTRASRQTSLADPTDRPDVLARTAWGLLERARGGRALRLLGVAGCDLVRGPGDGWLFAEERNRAGLLAAGDRLRDRFGEQVLRPAGVLLRRASRRTLTRPQ